MHSFFRWVASRWECDALNVLDYDHPIRFLGMELHRLPEGVELAQEGFINEILRSYHHQAARSQSQGSRETLLLSEEEEKALIDAEPAKVDMKSPAVKEAQKRVGEMLWLMGRTRPDLQHTVSIMASRITRCPEMVNTVGKRLLDYLCETKHYRLAFTQSQEENIEAVSVYTDSSFAPSGGRSHGAAVVFYGNNPLCWRAARQQLTTLSTAESELVEAVEGTLLGMSTRCLLNELQGHEVPLWTFVDNKAAIALLTTSSGSWRTRHLRLRSNWVRERHQNREIEVKFCPGEYQRADLGTKPFTRERLRQLVALWNLHDRRPTAEVRSMRPRTDDATWLQRLLLLCQVCGTWAQKQDLQTEVPWDLYLAVLILAVAIIGVWEAMKHCFRAPAAQVRALRTKATRASSGKLTRQELKELQMLLSMPPDELSREQKERMIDLREKFDDTMPEGCSPMPRFTTSTSTPSQPLGDDSVSSSSSTTITGRNKQPRPKETKDQETQADYVPAFERVQHQPPPRREVIAGPFYQVPGRDHVHVFRECWGLRNAGNVQRVTMCRCCIENGGHRIY